MGHVEAPRNPHNLRVQARLEEAARALARLAEPIEVRYGGTIERDAVLMRFVFTFAAIEQALRAVLLHRYRVRRSALRGAAAIFQSAQAEGLVHEADAAATERMVADRQTVLEACTDAAADDIHARLGFHAALMARILRVVEQASGKVKVHADS